MEFVSGNLFIRTPDVPMKQGEVVKGHLHTFDHTTYVQRGLLRIERVRCLREASGVMLEWTVDSTVEIRSTDPINWVLIDKDTWHVLTALEDDTVYQCIYSHRLPQALVAGPFTLPEPPVSKVDEHGVRWYRENDKVSQEAVVWREGYG